MSEEKKINGTPNGEEEKDNTTPAPAKDEATKDDPKKDETPVKEKKGFVETIVGFGKAALRFGKKAAPIVGAFAGGAAFATGVAYCVGGKEETVVDTIATEVTGETKEDSSKDEK